MSRPGTVHHLRLSVTDVARARDFYGAVFGFRVAVDAPPPPDDPDHELVRDNLRGGIVLTNDVLVLGLRPCDQQRVRAGDRFDPLRVGLDHVSIAVADLAELERVRQACAARGVEHGEVTELAPFGIAVLSVTDPDGIQFEVSAPLDES